MPQSDTLSQKSTKHKRTASGKLSTTGETELNVLRSHLNSDFDEGVLPVSIKFKLNSLFAQIEREFELLYVQNLNLQDKVETLLEKLDRESIINEKYVEINDIESVSNINKNLSKQKVLVSNPSAAKLKTTNKLKVQTSKIVSSFKTSLVNCFKVRSFAGHRDGVWDIAVRPGQPVLGSASADRTVRLWSTQTGKCLLQYSGHSGSVNSVRFLPNKDLVLSASGDKSVHIWQAVINWECLNNDNDSDLDESKELDESSITLRTPVKELLGHSNVVIAADWLSDGEQVITASWDRVANLFDVETGTILQSLTGELFTQSLTGE
uniref:WD repeat-containing protein 37 n=1 Tax=Cacopsylla melanoneura TaxID=428564 RepID=A0A8D9EYB9_9HEMI